MKIQAVVKILYKMKMLEIIITTIIIIIIISKSKNLKIIIIKKRKKMLKNKEIIGLILKLKRRQHY